RRVPGDGGRADRAGAGRLRLAGAGVPAPPVGRRRRDHRVLRPPVPLAARQLPPVRPGHGPGGAAGVVAATGAAPRRPRSTPPPPDAVLAGRGRLLLGRVDPAAPRVHGGGRPSGPGGGEGAPLRRLRLPARLARRARGCDASAVAALVEQ